MTIFSRIEKFMASHGGPTVKLNPPATEAQLVAAETAMGVKLPTEIREAYLRHNGVSRLTYFAIPAGAQRGPSLFLSRYDWVDLDKMVEEWKMMCGIEAEMKGCGAWQDVPDSDLHPDCQVRPIDWDRRWIPLGSNDTSDKVYIDLAPGPAGASGQLIYAGLPEGSELMATSLTSYLTRLMDAVDAGDLKTGPEGIWCNRAGERVIRLPA